jgi:hypothetical protein
MALQVQPQDKTVMANGLKLHYLDWGSRITRHWCSSTGCEGMPTPGTTLQPL